MNSCVFELREQPFRPFLALAGKMLGRERTSLNALAFDSTCQLIEGVLAAGVNLAEAYIDALGDTTKHRVRCRCRVHGCRNLGRRRVAWRFGRAGVGPTPAPQLACTTWGHRTIAGVRC